MSKVDRNKEYMYSMWGTDKLITDYGSENKKVLREVLNDDLLLNPKKHDFKTQNELHSQIRNDQDYDDWEYGTEPLYEFENK